MQSESCRHTPRGANRSRITAQGPENKKCAPGDCVRDVSDASDAKLTTNTYSWINRHAGTNHRSRGTVLETRDPVIGALLYGPPPFWVWKMTATKK